MKRYDFIVREDSFEPYAEEYELTTGDWVRYEDAEAEIEALQEQYKAQVNLADRGRSLIEEQQAEIEALSKKIDAFQSKRRCRALADEIETLKKENKRLRHANELLEKSGKHYLTFMQDAERYRHIRKRGMILNDALMWEEDLDAAIDAAMEGEK